MLRNTTLMNNIQIQHNLCYIKCILWREKHLYFILINGYQNNYGHLAKSCKISAKGFGANPFLFGVHNLEN